MKEKGVIKYDCTLRLAKPVDRSYIKEMNKWRDKLYSLGLIGVNNDDIGFGNISIRYLKDKFIITGSGTGRLKNLAPQHYSLVTEYDLNACALHCEGMIKASSESLSHAALYRCDTAVNAVIHIHSALLWKKLLNIMPTTSEKAEYGSKELIDEIIRIYNKSDLPKRKLLVMAGHEEGIITFGNSLDEAGTILMDNYARVL